VPREVAGRPALPVLPLPPDVLQRGEADPLGDRAERRPGPDRLQLLVIPDQDKFCALGLGLKNEARELPRSDHPGLVDDQNVPRPQLAPPGLPSVIPGRQRPALNARRLLKPLRRLARKRSAVNRVTLRLPSLARGGEHGALARPGEAHHGRKLLRPRDVLDRLPLLIAEPRSGNLGLPFALRQFAAFHLAARMRLRAPSDGLRLDRQRRLHMPPIDAVAAPIAHAHGAVRHPPLNVDHFARGIARKFDLAVRVRLLDLQLDQCR
jgi:hypothetical protein